MEVNAVGSISTTTKQDAAIPLYRAVTVLTIFDWPFLNGKQHGHGIVHGKFAVLKVRGKIWLGEKNIDQSGISLSDLLQITGSQSPQG